MHNPPLAPPIPFPSNTPSHTHTPVSACRHKACTQPYASLYLQLKKPVSDSSLTRTTLLTLTHRWSLVGIAYRPRGHAKTDQTCSCWSGNGTFHFNFHNFVMPDVLIMSFSLRQRFSYHCLEKEKNIFYNLFIMVDFVTFEVHCIR